MVVRMYSTMLSSIDYCCMPWSTFMPKTCKNHVVRSNYAALSIAKRPHSCVIRVSAMRALVQRVLSARVEVEGQMVSQIGPGLLVLVGISDSDTNADADFICRKILNMRLFTNDKTGKVWDQSVMQKNYEVLLVSQFTLCGFLRGNKPDFHLAMPPQEAKSFYSKFVESVSKSYLSDLVKDGIFGAKMEVHLVNDGPVTMQLDSRKTELEQANS